MLEKICNWIVGKMRKSIPMDDEKAEVILYGIQLIIGEIPKIFLLFVLSFILGIGWYVLFAFLVIMPYRATTGGFHLKSHLGCILGTSLFYYGNVYLSKFLNMDMITKYIVIFSLFIFGIIMVTLYASADTENLPILSKKERKMKKILSYIFLTLTLIAAVLITDNVLSNIIIIGVFLQTLFITRIAYKLTNNKYGYEAYQE